MANTDLDWLMNWYVRQCNNEWEHSYGVKIDTLDNPGWSIEIDLRGTSSEGVHYTSKQGEPSNDLNEWHELGSWWVAESDGARFKAACGPTDLSDVIGLFRSWVEKRVC